MRACWSYGVSWYADASLHTSVNSHSPIPPARYSYAVTRSATMGIPTLKLLNKIGQISGYFRVEMRKMRSQSSEKFIPAAAAALGNKLVAVNPGKVLTSST